jgi:hypothetical protein
MSSTLKKGWRTNNHLNVRYQKRRNTIIIKTQVGGSGVTARYGPMKNEKTMNIERGASIRILENRRKEKEAAVENYG